MLTLPIKKEWYHKICMYEKREEYREIKPYWTKRFINAGLLFEDGTPTFRKTEILLRNGYGMYAPTIKVHVYLFISKKGCKEWGFPDDGKKYYVLKLIGKEIVHIS